MSRPRWARAAAVVAGVAGVALCLAGSAAVADAPGPAAGADKVQFVGRAPTGSKVTEPAVSDNWTGGGSLVAWAQYGEAADLVLERVTDSGVKRIPLPLGGLTSFADPAIFFRATNDVWALASNASGGDLAATLGTYIWTSEDAKTWTQHKVWDSFGLPDMASDGHGGLWLITGLTGVEVVHVPASLETQSYGEHDQIELSDRIASRLEMGIAAIPKPFTLLTAFDSAKGVWVHVGTTPGQEHDIRMFKTGSYFEGLGANSRGALVIGRHPANYVNGGNPHLYGRYLTIGASGEVKVTPEFLISKQYVKDASLTSYDSIHEVAWITDTQKLYKATSSVKEHVKNTELGLGFPSGQWNNPAWPHYLHYNGWFAFAYDGQGRHSFVRVPPNSAG